jgi:hypothetical protein
MKKFLNDYKYIILGTGLGVLLMYIISGQVIDRRLNELKQVLEVSIQTSINEVRELVSVVSRGGVNEAASSVVADCKVAERAQFDNRLAKLDSGLNISELKELDGLFSRCAPVQSIQRAVMVMQLEQNVKAIKSQINQRKILGEYENFDEELKLLETLLSQEQKISKLSFDLVYLQKDIIEALLSGLDVNSEIANELKSKGLNIRNELIMASEKAAKTRSLLEIS